MSLDDRLEKLENRLKNPVFNFKCPTDKNYKLINNVCYYFESQKMKYHDAQLNCRLKVGQLGGHLFEPYTKVQYCKGLSENFMTNTTTASRYIYRDAAGFSNPGGLAVMWWA